MAFFADLSPYPYWAVQGFETVYVGWLDEGESFPVGETSQEFRDQLRELCRRPVSQTRGYHSCPFCKRMTGSAEIRVVGVADVYMAPDLIHHYVEVHRYKPPDGFIAAVLDSDDGY
jgi:hypothetical protein